jgi:hypothetical protein
MEKLNHIFEITFNKQVEQQRIKLDKILNSFKKGSDFLILKNDIFSITLKISSKKLYNNILNKK